MLSTPDFHFEVSLLPPTCRYLLGIDEVGRGPLAGPVTIGAFLLDLKNFDPQTFINLGIRDSKMLSSSQRQRIYSSFHLYQFKTFTLASSDIDQRGISQVVSSLVVQSLEFYQGAFDFCLLDGSLPTPVPSSRAIVKGDQKCFSVAAASIVAKVTRDALMDEFDVQYPQYGFKHHKGYGTKSHLEALKIYGPCPIHRFSYSPVKRTIL